MGPDRPPLRETRARGRPYLATTQPPNQRCDLEAIINLKATRAHENRKGDISPALRLEVDDRLTVAGWSGPADRQQPARCPAGGAGADGWEPTSQAPAERLRGC